MNLEPVLHEITNFAIKTYELSKSSFLYFSYSIKSVVSTSLIPVLKKISFIALITFNQLQKILQIGPSFIFGSATLLLISGVTAFKLADQKAIEDDLSAKTSWKGIGMIAFVSATALTSLGIASAISI